MYNTHPTFESYLICIIDLRKKHSRKGYIILQPSRNDKATNKPPSTSLFSVHSNNV